MSPFREIVMTGFIAMALVPSFVHAQSFQYRHTVPGLKEKPAIADVSAGALFHVDFRQSPNLAAVTEHVSGQVWSVNPGSLVNDASGTPALKLSAESGIPHQTFDNVENWRVSATFAPPHVAPVTDAFDVTMMAKLESGKLDRGSQRLALYRNGGYSNDGMIYQSAGIRSESGEIGSWLRYTSSDLSRYQVLVTEHIQRMAWQKSDGVFRIEINGKELASFPASDLDNLSGQYDMFHINAWTSGAALVSELKVEAM